MYKLILILNIANDEKIYLINSFSQKIMQLHKFKIYEKSNLNN